MSDNMYGLDFDIKSFAVANEFVTRMNKGCYDLGKALQPFCFFATELQKQWSVLDMTQFSGFVDNTNTLAKEIARYRRDQYMDSNYGIMPFTDAIDKALFYDYLLSISICYVEVPKYVTKNGQRQKIYDKYLATRNPSVMAAWMGSTPREMQAKYSARIGQSSIDFVQDELRVVKLTYSGKGNSISVPRNPIKVGGMTCLPLFMLYAFVNGFYEVMKTSIVKFTYLKDNDTIRELPSTVNFDILLDYYSNTSFIHGMLNGVDVFTMDEGGMMLSSKQSRGYIKVPELGCSQYDYSGVRSLNLSRLLRMEVVPSVDRTFINVDLNIVVDSFKQYIDSMCLTSPNTLIQIGKALGFSDEQLNITPASIAEAIKGYIDNCDAIMTTSFKRSLHLFMISHPEWFSTYTGVPRTLDDRSVFTSANNTGIDAYY